MPARIPTHTSGRRSFANSADSSFNQGPPASAVLCNTLLGRAHRHKIDCRLHHLRRFGSRAPWRHDHQDAESTKPGRVALRASWHIERISSLRSHPIRRCLLVALPATRSMRRIMGNRKVATAGSQTKTTTTVSMTAATATTTATATATNASSAACISSDMPGSMRGASLIRRYSAA